MQDSFFYKAVDDISNNFDEATTKQFLEMVVPWYVPRDCDIVASQAADDDDDDGNPTPAKKFNALDPRLSTMDGDTTMKATKFRAKLLAWLLNGANAGEEFSHTFVESINMSWQYFEENIGEDEVPEYDETVDGFIKGSQAIVQLLCPHDMSHCKVLEEVVSGLKKSKRKYIPDANAESFFNLAMAITKSTFYNKLFLSFMGNRGKLQDLVPKIEGALNKAQAAEDTLIKVTAMTDGLQTLARLEAEVADDLAMSWKKQVTDMAMKAAKHAIDTLPDASKMTIERRKEIGTALSGYFDICKEILAMKRPELHDFSLRLKSVTDQWASESSGAALEEILTKLKDQEILEHPDLEALDIMVTNFAGQLEKGDMQLFSHSALADAVINTIMHCHYIAAPLYAPKVADCLTSLGNITQTKNKTATNLVQALLVWPEVQDVVHYWVQLGGDVRSRVEADTESLKIKALLAAHAKLSACGVADFPEPFAKAISICFDDATRHKNEAALQMKNLARSSLEAAVEAMKPISLGHSEGLRWWADGDINNLSFDELASRSKATLMNIDGKALATTIDTAETKLVAFKAAQSMFDSSSEEDAAYEYICRNLLVTARATKYTALLLVLLADASPGAALPMRQKRQVRNVRTELASHAGVEDAMPRALLAKASEVVPSK